MRSTADADLLDNGGGLGKRDGGGASLKLTVYGRKLAISSEQGEDLGDLTYSQAHDKGRHGEGSGSEDPEVYTVRRRRWIVRCSKVCGCVTKGRSEEEK